VAITSSHIRPYRSYIYRIYCAYLNTTNNSSRRFIEIVRESPLKIQAYPVTGTMLVPDYKFACYRIKLELKSFVVRTLV